MSWSLSDLAKRNRVKKMKVIRLEAERHKLGTQPGRTPFHLWRIDPPTTTKRQ